MFDNKTLIEFDNEVRLPGSINAFSMYLHRLERQGLVIGRPEGATRRYFLSILGRDAFEYQEEVRRASAILNQMIGDDETNVTRVKERIQQLSSEEVRNGCSHSEVPIELLKCAVNPIADSVHDLLGSIRSFHDIKLASRIEKNCSNILYILQEMEMAIVFYWFLAPRKE